MAQRRVVIIGGGLAGMTVAKEVLRHRVPVLLLEAGSRLGGKAGADQVDGRQVEHGYHVFPGWYLNVRQLLGELGIQGDLIDVEEFFHLRRGEFPTFIPFHAPSSLRNVAKNVCSGLLPWPEALLSMFFGLDLASQSFSNRAYLDRVSASGFLRSRFYATERIAVLHQQTILQTSAVPNYEVAAMSVQKLAQCGLGTPTPIFSILDGNLQDKLIEPFEKFLRAHGTEIRLNRKVARLELGESGRVRALHSEDGSVIEGVGADDIFVLATPLEVTRQFVDAAVYAAEHAGDDDEKSLADLMHLRTAHMAAIEVYCTRRLRRIPKGHVTLYDSRYGLSFIDVSHHWPGLKQSKLCMIASDFEPLRGLPEAEMAKYLIKELRSYVPEITARDIDRWVMRTNLEDPLFINTVGAWTFRPATRTCIDNLYITGDYCRSEADLATMESAVSSALSTARDLLKMEGLGTAAGPQPLKIPPRTQLLLAKYLALSVAGPIGLCYWAGRRLQDGLRESGLARK